MSFKILAPIDLADRVSAARVMEEAVRMTDATGGELTVMTVVPNFVTGIDYRYAIRGETGGSVEYDAKKVVADALGELNRFVAENTPEHINAKTVARRGTVYEQVLNFADEYHPNQIIMGAHRPGLSDFLLGPNTARIVRHAKCSVNVLRDPE